MAGGRLTRGALVAFASLLFYAGPVCAEPSAAEKETARALMAEGRELRDRKALREALARFQAADGLMHVPTTALEVARTQVALGLLAEARETVQRLRQVAAREDEPAPFREARASADALHADLKDRIGAMRFVVRGAPAGTVPTITVDSVNIPTVATEMPFRANPG